jgi:hypothetical protein
MLLCSESCSAMVVHWASGLRALRRATTTAGLADYFSNLL